MALTWNLYCLYYLNKTCPPSHCHSSLMATGALGHTHVRLHVLSIQDQNKAQDNTRAKRIIVIHASIYTVYIYIYIYIYIYTHAYIYIYACTCTYISYMALYIYIYIYIYTYTYMHIHAHIYHIWHEVTKIVYSCYISIGNKSMYCIL